MPNALKACWTVRAGVIPGQVVPESCRRFEYTSEDDERDSRQNPEKSPYFHARFSKIRAEAIDYFLQISLPHLNNWAEIHFLWL